MKLTENEIRQIIIGAVRITEENGAVTPYRFTVGQEELYRERWADFLLRSLASAGIKLSFETDSTALTLQVTVEPGSSRQYFSVDVFANGEVVGYMDNFNEADMVGNYVQTECSLGTFRKTFSLGEGVKRVCIHLPWSAKTTIEELSLEEGAYVRSVKPDKKLLVFGDSITQGYDALRPSNRYTARLAEALGAEEVNKAIGGEVFYPELAKEKEHFMPDYITVAYGTNDWSGKDHYTFVENCRAFYETLCKTYPDARIFAITPIWRKDKDDKRPFGAFESIEMHIKDLVSDLPNVTVISGIDLVPGTETLYADLRLHPNDKGFRFYFEHLYEKVKPYIND